MFARTPQGGEAWGGFGCPDEDRDGWADPSNGPQFVEEDMCPSEVGEATTSTGRGCPDDETDGPILRTTSPTMTATI